MIDNRLIYLISSILFLVGLYGVMTRRNLIKILVSISIIETAVNIFITGLGYIEGSRIPVITKELGSVSKTGANISDPLPHALVLTSIVIGVGTTALGLAIAMRLYAHYKTLNITAMEGKDELK